MSRRSRWAPVVVALLLAAACGGSGDDDAGTAEDRGGGPTTASSVSSSTSTSAPASGGSGPAPLVPSPGQAWSDLYPNGAPPVFPLPGSSRALGSPQAAATAFARDMLGMESAQLAVDSQDGDRAALVLQGAPASTRLDLRRGELGWEVVGATADGLDLTVAGATGSGGPTGVDRTIDVTGAPGAPAGTTVDVVDLADGRLVLRQPLSAVSGTAAGPLTLTLPDPLPQLAAVIFYVPAGPAPADPAAARRASAASVSPVHVQA